MPLSQECRKKLVGNVYDTLDTGPMRVVDPVGQPSQTMKPRILYYAKVVEFTSLEIKRCEDAGNEPSSEGATER